VLRLIYLAAPRLPLVDRPPLPGMDLSLNIEIAAAVAAGTHFYLGTNTRADGEYVVLGTKDTQAVSLLATLGIIALTLLRYLD